MLSARKYVFSIDYSSALFNISKSPDLTFEIAHLQFIIKIITLGSMSIKHMSINLIQMIFIRFALIF